jgi:2-oxoisovalerate dehydrogenase E1 component alpha subunit
MDAEPRTARVAAGPDGILAPFLPSSAPIRFLDEAGRAVPPGGRYALPTDAALLAAYRWMVLARRFDVQATALAKQGRIAAYPSSFGQEATEVAAAAALHPGDWFFPTYRDSAALLVRGVDPIDVLAPVRGHQHCGYDPYEHRCAPMTTPLATQAVHAVGLAHAARLQGDDVVALVFVGDGASSEGDFHEAVNFAAVFRAPVVFVIQNNRYAISVPQIRQTAAPALAYKGIGYGVRSEQVDGNDAAAVLAVVDTALEHARSGAGPMLVEAQTFRIGPHTSTDDPSRYRDDAETEIWRQRDPLRRLRAFLRDRDLLDADAEAALGEQAEALAARVRAGVARTEPTDPAEAVFAHVYARPPLQLLEQRATMESELAAEQIPEPVPERRPGADRLPSLEAR